MSSLLTDLLEELHPSLPLPVDRVSWDGLRLNLEGEGWGFHTMSPWRLISSDRLIQGSEEAKDDKLLRTLEGDFIDDVAAGGPPYVDPVFSFRSGLVLQVFSIHSLEPWTFVVPSGRFYAASPADPSA